MGNRLAGETTTVSILVTPDPADVNQPATADASFDGPTGGDVTITIKNAGGTIIRQRTFSADPYTLSFTPATTGLWSVDVSWPGNSRTKNFQVQ